MTKTQNYNLNKPETTDPMRLADFNENSEILDAALAAAYSPDNLPWEVGTLDLSSAVIGDVVKTFDFVPSVVFFFDSTVISGAVINGKYTKICDLLDTSVYRNIILEGNTLSQGFICGGPVSTLYYVALK